MGSLATSAAPEGGTWKAGYLQTAYRIDGTKWEPVLRYGKYTSPHADQSQKQLGVGLNYWIQPNVVAKLAFETNKGLRGTATDANRVLMQFAYGF